MAESTVETRKCKERQEKYRAKSKLWYSKNKELLLAQKKIKYRDKNVERRKEKELRLRKEVLLAGILKCNNCEETKQLSEFRCRINRNGIEFPYYEKICKKCLNKQLREWRDRDLDEANRKAREYLRVNREKINAKRRLKGHPTSRNRRSRIKSVIFIPVTRVQIEGLLLKQRRRCAICKKQLTKFHIDHIMPVAKGGSHEIGNLQILCPKCNLRKHATHPIDYMQKLGFLL